MKDFWVFFNERTQKFNAEPKGTSAQARPIGVRPEDRGPAQTRRQHLPGRLRKGMQVHLRKAGGSNKSQNRESPSEDVSV